MVLPHISSLIQGNKFFIELQPIVSFSKKKTIGFEALTRIKDKEAGSYSLARVFTSAKQQKRITELDNHLRCLSLEKFQKYYKKDKTLMLFLNFESESLAHNDFDEFLKLVKDLKIATKNIVIEIKEDAILNNESLQETIHFFKRLGFYIAVDDFGSGFSSFDRISIIRPNLIKIDKSILQDCHSDFVKLKIISSIVDLAGSIGAFVLAEGVEKEIDVVHCLKKDIDIFQGWYFAKSFSDLESKDIEKINKQIEKLFFRYESHVLADIEKEKSITNKVYNVAKKIIHNFSDFHLEKNTKKIKQFFGDIHGLESVFFIEPKSGKEISYHSLSPSKQFFYGDSGTTFDHRFKEYFYLLDDSPNNTYMGKTYISSSGKLCRTFSMKIKNKNVQYIMCFNILI